MDLFNKILPTMYHSELEDNQWQEKELIKLCKKLGIIMNYDNIMVNYENNEYSGDVIFKEMVK